MLTSSTLEKEWRCAARELQHHLTDALVIRINTKLLHKAVPLSTPRYNLTFRHLKPEFLPHVEAEIQLRLLV